MDAEAFEGADGLVEVGGGVPAAVPGDVGGAAEVVTPAPGTRLDSVVHPGLRATPGDDDLTTQPGETKDPVEEH